MSELHGRLAVIYLDRRRLPPRCLRENLRLRHRTGRHALRGCCLGHLASPRRFVWEDSQPHSDSYGPAAMCQWIARARPQSIVRRTGARRQRRITAVPPPSPANQITASLPSINHCQQRGLLPTPHPAREEVRPTPHTQRVSTACSAVSPLQTSARRYPSAEEATPSSPAP